MANLINDAFTGNFEQLLNGKQRTSILWIPRAHILELEYGKQILRKHPTSGRKYNILNFIHIGGVRKPIFNFVFVEG